MSPADGSPREPVEPLRIPAGRVHVHPRLEVREQEAELGLDTGRDPPRLLDGRRRRATRHPPHQLAAVSATVSAVSRAEARLTHSSIPWMFPAIGP